MKISYFPGCTLKTSAQNFESSAVSSAKILGVEMVELPRWNCCGVVTSLATDDLIHHVAAIRNLVRVQEMNKNGLVKDNYNLLTLCTMCFHTMARANLRMKENPEDLKSINNFMYLEEDYEGKVEVVHFLDLLRDTIGFDKVKEKVKKPLKSLKIAPYYGCMLLRPKEIGIDDPESPTIQRDLLIALGADDIENAYGKRCCGSYQTLQDKNVIADLAYDILSRARLEGAEAISLSCPLCAFNLDNRQKEVVEKHPEFKPMPVFYFTQLMALAFGLDERFCGFDSNYIDPRPLLKEKNLI